MATLLYIEASPRKERSISIAVAKEFLRAYTEAHPADAVETLDLWAAALPEFDGAAINAKYNILHGLPHSATEAKAWGAVEALCRHFKAADKYLFSVPMWNFGIPYKLKHYLDLIVQPGLTFSHSPEQGFTGLVSGKPAAVIYASGGEYGPASPAKDYDLQKPYMNLILGFIGITGVRSIAAAPSLAAPETAKAALDTAIQQAVKLGKVF